MLRGDLSLWQVDKVSQKTSSILTLRSVVFSITLVGRSPRESINYFARGAAFQNGKFSRWRTETIMLDHMVVCCSMQHAATRGHHPPIRSPLTIPRLIGLYVIMRQATHARRHASFPLGVSWTVSPSRFLLRVNLPYLSKQHAYKYVCICVYKVSGLFYILLLVDTWNLKYFAYR